MVQHIRQSRHARGIAAMLCSTAVIMAVSAAVLAVLSTSAAAWGERAHNRIAEFAIDSLPAHSRGTLLLYKDDLTRGVHDGLKQQHVGSGKEISADIQLLMLIPHNGDDLTRYFAYRLGQLSVTVADCALPLSDAVASDSNLRKRLEADIDADAEFYRVSAVTPTVLTYSVLYLKHVKSDAQKSEEFIKTRYAAGDGYRACRDDLLYPAFKNAVQAVASLWETILAKEPAPGELSPPIRAMYYTNQIKYGSEQGHLDDVEQALQKLKEEDRRIPLSAAFVGDAFFNLPFCNKSKSIYKLAGQVDPRCSSASNRLNACEEYLKENPEQTSTDTVQRRKIPRYLYGRDGKPPAIYVYQHTSGLLLLTSKVKDLGPDYVLLNFEPIKKITKRKVVRKVKNEPEVEEYDLEEIIKEYAKEYNVPPALVKAVIKVESNYDPFAVSVCGARGLMQLMPSTALEMQVEDIFDPSQNIGGGVQYLARMLELFNDDLKLALAAYNAGPGNVLRYGGVPPFKETRKYVPRVLACYEDYKKDTSPVMLKVAMNKKPSADYLPEVEVVEEVEEETVVSSPPVPKPPADKVIVYLKNGNTMRGDAYEKTPDGIRLILKNGSIIIRDDLITKIS